MAKSPALRDPIKTRCAGCFGAIMKRARRTGELLDFGLLDLLRLARSTDICPYCRNVLPPSLLTFDHKVPLARGGRSELANLGVCCQPCNAAKGLLDADEFQALRQLLRSFHPRAYGDVLLRLRAGGARYGTKK
jgi:hypothetical protein